MPVPTDTPVTYPFYTNEALKEGVFDRLVVAARKHIRDEYENGRIDKATYGASLIQLMEAAMTQSTQYLLGTLLLSEKARGQDLQNQKLEYELEFILPASYDKIIKEIAVLDKEIEKMAQEILVLKAEEDLKRAQITLTNKQIEKITAEISLMGKQEDKIDKEIEFMTAKIMTERANTEAGIADSGSLLGRQMQLLQAQRMGFAGDIQSKMAQLYAQYDGIYQTVQEVETGTTLNAPTISQIGEAEAVASSIMGIS